MKRAIVLFGAGASVEFKAPSTIGLTNKIEQEVMADHVMKMTGGDAAFQAIKTGLAGYLEKPGIVNFEQIYHCAHELIFTYPPTPGAYDEFKPIMVPFVSNTTGLTKDALSALCGKIVQIIIEEVSHSCDSNTRDLGPLTRFVEALRADYVTRIYTTNYDDFALLWPIAFRASVLDSSKHQGFGGSLSGPYFDRKRRRLRERIFCSILITIIV